jgi:hypothetical protein
VVVETRYAAGSGVLLGTGPHWLLVTDPGDEEVVAELWAVLSSGASDGAPIADRVLAVVDRAFDREPPALAMIDLSSPAGGFVSRGAGRVRVEGPTRVLSLGQVPATGSRPLRRVVGGIVAADLAEVTPSAPQTTGQPSGRPAPAAPAHGLIDGIPAAILAARGPERPPPPRSLHHTAEPDPLVSERIEEGVSTTIRPPRDDAAREAAAPPADDHDGATVLREPADHLRATTRETVLAVSCPTGHLTPPSSPACRVCHQPVGPQEPQRVARPTLGGLRLPTGEVVPLDRGVVLGRRPAPVEGSSDWPHLVHLPADHSFVSRMHLQVELDGWHVVARDLGSRGGTLLTAPGRRPEWLRAGEAHVLEPGQVLDLAEVYEVRFEVGPVTGR